ncbi:hypothetical protein BDR22DRAFT_888807 [Usnea florida]
MAAPSPPTQDINLRGMTVSSISLVTLVVGANLVFLRMYVRMKRHVTGWDDYIICVALALSLLATVANVYQVAYGIGRHINTLTPALLSGLIKWTFVQGVTFVISTFFVKVSVCLFILRFINKTRRSIRYFIYILLGFLIVSTLSLVIALLAQCRPLKALYDFDIKGKCYSKNVSVAIAYIQGAINTFTDFTCACLPFFIVRTLQMKRSLKIGLSIIMGLGFITACFSVLRLGFLYTNSSADFTYNDSTNAVFAILEMNLGIIAASIATLRPLFASLGPMVRVPSDTPPERYASDRPFAKNPKASKAGRQPTSIPLDPMNVTKTSDVEVSQQSFRDTLEERG